MRTTLGLLLLLTACAGQKTPPASMQMPVDQVKETQTESGLVQQSVDLDRDGRAEIVNEYRERLDAPRLLVRKQMDLNRDGEMDVRSYFDDDGRLKKEEMDSDYDRIFDHVDYYQDGVRVMTEYDTDQDTKPNVFKYYVRDASGVPVLDRKERDENGDGKIDVWERFDAEGNVTRTGRDTDGDGKMDVRED